MQNDHPVINTQNDHPLINQIVHWTSALRGNTVYRCHVKKKKHYFENDLLHGLFVLSVMVILSMQIFITYNLVDFFVKSVFCRSPRIKLYLFQLKLLLIITKNTKYKKD